MDASIRELWKMARARKCDAGNEQHLVNCFRRLRPEDQTEVLIHAERLALAQIRMRLALRRARAS